MGMTIHQAQSVADTILHQLGGNRFIAMTGAKLFVDLDGGLQFKFPAARDGINTAVIDLNASDQYDITYYKIRGAKVEERQTDWDVPVENLKTSFSDATGLILDPFAHGEQGQMQLTQDNHAPLCTNVAQPRGGCRF
jgi:hypothetical protein